MLIQAISVCDKQAQEEGPVFEFKENIVLYDASCFVVAYLKVNGIKLNKYDPCIDNKVIDGKQCTTYCHNDASKISHEVPKVIDSITETLRILFKEVTVTRGE